MKQRLKPKISYMRRVKRKPTISFWMVHAFILLWLTSCLLISKAHSSPEAETAKFLRELGQRNLEITEDDFNNVKKENKNDEPKIELVDPSDAELNELERVQ